MKQLSRDEMKKVAGGVAPPKTVTSCSCTLKSSTGVSLNVPISPGSSTTDSDCKSACSTNCSTANAVGGNCASYSYQFTTTTTPA